VRKSTFLRMGRTILPVLLALSALQPVRAGHGAGILDSPHNLSAGSSARIKAADEKRVCIFCHTPHHATLSSDPEFSGPLWSREENGQIYTVYDSSTIVGLPRQPQGPSRLCLSCHDGTIALAGPANRNMAANLPSLDSFAAPPAPKKTAVLGLNLADDHPISMEYGAAPGEFHDAGSLLSNNIRLSRRAGALYVECTSCHNPHDNRFGGFLVQDISQHADALCTACHDKNGWSGSAHQTGGTRFSGAEPQTVAQKGCVNCHTSHGAEHEVNLLNLTAAGAGLDSNCFSSCHNGTDPYSDIPGQFNPAGRYAHPLGYDAGGEKHLSTERLPLAASDKHVHCVDCHNPHQTEWRDAPLAASDAPKVNGVLQGMRGVSMSEAPVEPAAYEYQVCFRCHAGSAAGDGNFHDPTLQVTRVFTSFNQSERFNPASAISYHPIAAPFPAGQSLSPTADTNYIYCSSCHHPHGSDEPHMLRLANPDTFSSGQSTSYPLCYSCHDQTSLMNTAPSAALHKAHVYGLHLSGGTARVSCSACHDPHGVPFIAGRSTSDNGAHLINFDLRYAPAAAAYSSKNQSCSLPTLPGTSGVVCHPAAVTQPAVYNPYPFSP